jgi:hypothetical protein
VGQLQSQHTGVVIVLDAGGGAGTAVLSRG